MENRWSRAGVRGLLVGLGSALLVCGWSGTGAAIPVVLDPNLQVRTVVSGLSVPTSMAFLGSNDLLVLEKNTGRVQRVVNGLVQGTVLDLAVNFASERGLLGIALHPNFPTNPAVYLYWTESTTGADSNVLANTPLLGNRVDRFIWNGSTLTFDQNITMLRALQPPNPPVETQQFGNHNGGVLRFGPDGKLYITVGDVGRRGQMQNLPCGPTGTCPGPIVPDDQFGGPQPDNAHFTGVILRLNPDGSTPADNPFFAVGGAIGGQVGANIQKVFAYGIRNSFGVAFDPKSGNLWMEDNGDSAFDELNRVFPGLNGGWVQIMGPAARIGQYKSIETTMFGGSLQQSRWPPSNIADTEADALARLFALLGSQYSDPEFSWKFGVAPAGIGFLDGTALGPEYEGDLFVGAATTLLEGGYLFRFNLTADRLGIAISDPRLLDLVADNLNKFDITESEILLFGRNFGVVTDIHTGLNGHLFLVSLTDGAIYEVFSRVSRAPAPGTAALIAAGLLVLGLLRRRRGRARSEGGGVRA